MRRLFLLSLLLVLLAPAAIQSQSLPDHRFGLIETYEAPGEAAAAGAAWTRIRFQWAEIQAGGPDSWTPAVTDAQIAAETAAGREIVGLLIGIPDWARDDDRLPRGLWLPPDDPGNTWAAFVRQAVTRYQGQISRWIIWNEPDIRPGALGHTWDGAIDDFYQLQRTAYLVAKAANPAAIIHLPAFTYWADVYAGEEQTMARLLDRILADPEAPAHNHYFDVATAHLYFQPSQIYDLTQFFLGLMRTRGLNKPIWLVETNAPPLDDPVWPVADWTLSVTLDEQAAFMPQALASALAAGAGRVAVYKLKDTPDDRAANPEPFGLVRMNGSRRPSFTTYRLAVEYLAGMTGAERERWNEVGQIRIDQPGQSTTVLFARLPLPQQATVAATADTAVLADMWGGRRTITAEDGLFVVELPPALCTQPIGDYCMIGGTTFYLVQDRPDRAPLPLPAGDAPPTPGPSPTARPELVQRVTNTPLPSFTPSPTAPPRTATPSPRPSRTTAVIRPSPSPTAVLTPTAVPPEPSEEIEQPPGGTAVRLYVIGLALLLGLGWLTLRRQASFRRR